MNRNLFYGRSCQVCIILIDGKLIYFLFVFRILAYDNLTCDFSAVWQPTFKFWMSTASQ